MKWVTSAVFAFVQRPRHENDHSFP